MKQPEENHPHKDTIGRRALEGLIEGACWGAGIGVLKGIIRIFRTDRPWFMELGGAIVLGIVLGSVICAIGKGISGRYLGAWLGTVPGLLIGWFAGSAVGSYRWKVTEEAGGTTTMVGYPIGADIGLAAGALLGAVIGALIHRFVIIRTEFNRKEQT